MREVLIRAKRPEEMWDGNRVRELRLRYGETQEEFAKHFRASKETIRSWEQGKSKVSGMGSVILERLEEAAAAVKAG